MNHRPIDLRKPHPDFTIVRLWCAALKRNESDAPTDYENRLLAELDRRDIWIDALQYLPHYLYWSELGYGKDARGRTPKADALHALIHIENQLTERIAARREAESLESVK